MVKKDNSNKIADNRKAFHEYFIEEKYEAGVSLKGTEIKSIRMGKINLKEGYVRIEKGEALLYNVHISHYTHGNIYNHDPLRVRKLLLHKREIMKLLGKTKETGYTIVPLRMYWVNGWAKVQIGLAKGKLKHDKRETIKKRDQKREMDRAIRKFV